MFRVLEHITAWRYEGPTGGRDLRLDLLRGFAVFAMVVDHIGGESWITPFTGLDQFLVSAAEPFVFVSGFLMGQVYGRRIERRGWVNAAEAMLHRAVLLYLVTVGLTLLFVGLFLYTDLRLWLDRAYGLGLTDPVELVIGTLTLHYTYHGTDILWMYTVLIAAAPLLFHLLITDRTKHLVTASVALWLVYQLFPAQATIPWVVANAVYFPVAAWQILFVVGLALGYHREQLGEKLKVLPEWPLFAVFTLTFLGLVLLDQANEQGRLASWPVLSWLAGERWDAVFNKPAVAWGRLLALALAAPFFFLLVTRFWRPIYGLSGWLLMPLGQSALIAYSVHLIVIVVIYNTAGQFVGTDDRGSNTIGQALGVALVWLVVRVWHRLGEVEERLHLWWSKRVRIVGARRWQTMGAASAVIVIVAILTTVLLGPVRTSRPAETAADSSPAGTLLFVPDVPAGQPVTAVIVLPDSRGTGPRTAGRLVEEARSAGWALVAPTVETAAWTSPEDAFAAASASLPDLSRFVAQLEQRIERPVEPGVLLVARGAGAQLAYHFALLYPELVRGLALVDFLPCTLPVPLEYPHGILHAERFRMREIELSRYQGLAIALVQPIPSTGADSLVCEWTGQPIGAQTQLQQAIATWREVGATVVVSSEAGAGPAQAMTALRSAMREARD